MAVILAFEKLYDDCVQRFIVEGTFGDVAPLPPTNLTLAARANPFGWREPGRQVGANAPGRIVWVPGDDKSGDLGVLGAPKFPGRTDPGRPLGTLYELFTCYISGADDTDRDNERLQYHATRLLYDAWARALYLAAHGTYEVLTQAWVVGDSGKPRAERRYGTAIRVTGAIQAMIPDSTPTIVAPPLEADLTVQELSVTDPQFVVTYP